MKQLLLKASMALVALCLCTSAMASTNWTLNSKEYKVDTLYHAKIGPGTTQTSLKLSGGGNLQIFYITVDLTNPNVDIRSTMGGNKVAGTSALSTMARTNSKEGAKYFAGVNADFFNTAAPYVGTPIGTSVIDGEPWYVPSNSRHHFYMTSEKEPVVGQVKYKAKVVKADGTSNTLSTINTTRGENKLVLYTPRIGANTATNSYGQEVTLEPIEGNFGLMGDVKCRVTCAPNPNGSMTIPADGFVLSGHGTAATFVSSLAEGDVVTIQTTTTIPQAGTIQTLAGGEPIILQNGEVTNNTTSLDHLTALHPRTAVGYSSDRTKLVLLVVDGRSSISAGVLSKTLGEIMKYVGCSDAMNFDGGGSSELYCSDLGVINVPSDGNERGVGNAVFAVATSPTDNEIAEIGFMDHAVTVPRYGYYTPRIYGYNKYGVLVSTNVTGFTLSCDTALGEIHNDGTSLFSNGTGSHALTATYNGITATIPVTIGSAQPHMRLATVITDSFHDYTAEVVARIGLTDMPLDNKALTWSSSDTSIATVNADGVVHGIRSGQATITGAVGEFSDSFVIDVQVPASRRISVGLNVEDWTYTGTMLSNVSLTQTATGGIAAQYTIKTKRGNAISVGKSTTLESIPDSVRVVFNPGDAQITKITLYGQGAGLAESSTAATLTIVANEPNTVLFAVKDFADTSDFKNLPVEFSRVHFALNDAGSSTHTIEIMAIDGVYINVPEGQSSAQGDVNGDGKVDVNDIGEFINIYVGATPATPGADTNGDGVIDLVDLGIIINRIIGM